MGGWRWRDEGRRRWAGEGLIVSLFIYANELEGRCDWLS